MGACDRCRDRARGRWGIGLLTGTPVTPAIVFVLVGVLVGPLVFDDVTAAPAGEGVRTLADATLAVVLFAETRTRVSGP